MAHARCERHGCQPAELMANNVIDLIRNGVGSDFKRVFPMTLVYQELEYPSYGTAEDRTILPSFGGVWGSEEICTFVDEGAMEKAIGLFSAICAKCLAEVL